MTSALSIAPQRALGKAIVYTQSIFPKAIKFIEHLFLTPDTNAVENAIRFFVIGRKNWYSPAAQTERMPVPAFIA
jgi:transposase